MLELIGSGLVSMWLEMAGVHLRPFNPLDLLTWQSSPSLIVAPDPNPATTVVVQNYFQQLVTSKIMPANLLASQGIWIQSGPILMANYQGTSPLSAASLTKIATSLVALKTWGADHQFETLVSATGPVQNGVLQGDLVITGGGDPLFVWEEAITLGNTLNRMGIKQVKGNLVIAGNFAMNFQQNPLLAGQALKQALNYTSWSRAITWQYSLMPKGTPKPQVKIAGTVKLQSQPSPQQTLLIRHRSLPLHRLIKEMNVFSNNDMAQMLADSVGGYTVVQSTAAKLARVPESEIQLINGSGLGVENRISPRAICAMFMAIQREALSQGLNLADLFPVSGFDHRGTLHARHIPAGTIIKTGTLNAVSSLAGVMPTRDRGLVWFAIINHGPYVSTFRAQQDKLLQQLSKTLQAPTVIPAEFAPRSAIESLPKLGAVERNEIISRS
jgi:D-alanyl-D-alanine carboxypeptidase/D-alanyl-D-alanine-endopeptidase (penicillin-binding protein 4)